MLNFSYASVLDDIKRWSRRGTASVAATDVDSLDAFGSEDEPAAPASRPAPEGGLVARLGDARTRVGILVTLAIIVAGGLTGYLLQKWPVSRVQAASGSVTIESDPAGAS